MNSRAMMPIAYVAALCFALILAIPTSAMAKSGVNGRNVTTVQTAETAFRLVPGKQWIEGANGAEDFRFAEENRDDWSVYLRDDSRGVRLQLDLHTKNVYYSDASSPRRELYRITDASSIVNGRNVIGVKFQGGRLTMTGGTNWVEQGNNGGQFNFVEDNRDDWSVYLSDASRGVRLQVDLHRKLISYADAGAPNMRPLYPITKSTATGQ